MKRLFTIAVLLSAFICGCETIKPEKVEGAIKLYVDTDVIMADGEHTAKLMVTVMDSLGVEQDVTSSVEIYLDGADEPLASSGFATTEAGTYSFYAISGFEISNTVSVRAVKGDLALPAEEDRMDFNHRMLLLQHTGTECPNCPRLMTQLRYLSDDQSYNTKYHHVASHSYNASDPAYTSDATSLSKNFNVSVYPWLTYDLTTSYELDFDNIRTSIDKMHKGSSSAGIAAVVDCDENGVYANVRLKAGKAGKYRLAAWLLEDNIRAAQSGADASWQNVHENCLRSMYGENKTERIYGKNLGEFKAGESKSFLVAFDLESGWKGENCKVIFLAVNADNYEMLNCAVCPMGESVGYEYVK